MPAWSVYLFFLVIVGISVHAGLGLPELATHPDVLNFDAYEYFDAAKMFYTEAGRPHPTRMAGFPLLTGWITLWSSDPEDYFALTYGFNAACWLGTGLLLWSLGGRLLPRSPWLSRLPALLFGLNVGGLVLVSQPLTETFYAFLLVAGVWCWERSRENGGEGRRLKSPVQGWWLFAAWCCLVYATWVRPTGFLWLFALGPVLVGIFWMSKNFIEEKLRLKQFFPLVSVLAVLLPVALTLGWQLNAMHAAYGQWRLSNIGPLTYYLYTDAYAGGWAAGQTWEERSAAWGRERDGRKRAWGLEPDHRAGVLRIHDWPAINDTIGRRSRGTWQSRPWALAASLSRNLVSNALAGSMNAQFLADRAADPGLQTRARMVFWLSRLQNAFYSGLTVVILALALRHFRRPRPADWFFGLPAAFALTVFAGSAISFAQGDRFYVAVAPVAMLGLLFLLWKKF
jgi:hypothetical protein